MDGGTISKLAQRVKELASKFKPQEAANALWALVKLDQQNGGNAMKVLPEGPLVDMAIFGSCCKLLLVTKLLCLGSLPLCPSVSVQHIESVLQCMALITLTVLP